MSPDLARRKRTESPHGHHHAGVLPRTGLALLIGLVVLVGIIVLPAFASESGGADAPSPSPTTPPTTVVDQTPTTVATEAVEATLASLTDEERVAMGYYFMTAEEREAFARFISPPPAPEPQPEPAPVEVVPAAPAPAAPAGSVWDQIAYCETGGNWAHPPVGSYGYSGGLMFLPSTWRNYGGGEFASQAYQASRDAQIIVAERILASHGGSYKAWPGCRAKLGLR